MTDEEFAAKATASPPAFHVPWEPSAEQWGRNRYWADYACWESYMEGKFDASPNEDVLAQWEAMDTPLRAVLYGAMIDACKFTAEGKIQ